MLSKRTSYDDRLQGSSRTQREYTPPELEMNVVSLPISQNPNGPSEDGANILGPSAKSWCLGLLFTQFQSQTGLKEYGANLSLFKLRTCLPKTTWNPQASHITIPPPVRPMPRFLLEMVLLCGESVPASLLQPVHARLYATWSAATSSIALWVSVTSPHSLALPIPQTVYWAPEVYSSLNHHKNSVCPSSPSTLRSEPELGLLSLVPLPHTISFCSFPPTLACSLQGSLRKNWTDLGKKEECQSDTLISRKIAFHSLMFHKFAWFQFQD